MHKQNSKWSTTKLKINKVYNTNVVTLLFYDVKWRLISSCDPSENQHLDIKQHINAVYKQQPTC